MVQASTTSDVNLDLSKGNCTEVDLNYALQHLQRCFVSANKDIISHAAQIKQVTELLQDEESRQQYNQEIAYLAASRINQESAEKISPFKEEWLIDISMQLSKMLQQPDCPSFKVHSSEAGYMHTMLATTFIIEQYRYKDILDVEPGDIFIDCGACIGDTALWAYKKGASKVYSFEPGNSNLEILKLNLEGNNHDPSLIIPAAVGKENTTLKFISGLGMAGAAHTADEQQIKEVYEQAESKEQAEQYIQTVQSIKLDDWFTQNNIEPTFIKMDIEGAELSALMGASATIKRLKPKLTICLYHQVKDMWELPLYIHAIVPEYKFYCRKNQVRNEFILYATTK